MTKLKQCHACREMIDYEATICPKCRSKQKKGMSNTGAALVVGIAILLLFILGTGGDGDTSAAQAEASLLPTATVEACNKAIAESESSGLIKGRPANNRINVEDLAWAAMPADDKRALLSLVGCAAFRKKAEDFDLSEYVVAYGHRSGKRLAMFSEVGAQFE